MNVKEEFHRVIDDNIKRDGIGDLVEWLNNSDFFTAPASTRFHENWEGGLAFHSLRVYSHLLKLNEAYGTNYTKETLAIVSLFHDLCKVGCYKQEMRWRKDANDKWEQYTVYKFEEDFVFGGHGSKSVYLVQHFMKLNPEEASAINCHMGVENAKWEVFDAFRANPLAFLLHTADMASTIDGLNEHNNPVPNN